MSTLVYEQLFDSSGGDEVMMRLVEWCHASLSSSLLSVGKICPSNLKCHKKIIS